MTLPEAQKNGAMTHAQTPMVENVHRPAPLDRAQEIVRTGT